MIAEKYIEKQIDNTMIEDAYVKGVLAGRKSGWHDGYQAGMKYGKNLGRHEGRRQRTEATHREGAEALAVHLAPVLAQVKEGSPVAAAIAERIETAIGQYLENKA